MGNILKLVNRKKLALIEDSAETLGGDWQGKKLCSVWYRLFFILSNKEYYNWRRWHVDHK